MPPRDNSQPPADKYPAGTIVIEEDGTEVRSRGPAQAPGTPQMKSVDNRPQHAKDLDEEGTWEKVDDTENMAPFNSPDEPYSLKLRKPIMSSSKGGQIDTLVLSPPRVDTFEKFGAFVAYNSEIYENKRTGESKKRTWFETDYAKMLNHISAATRVPVIELRGLSIADAERAGGILSSMASAMPFR